MPAIQIDNDFFNQDAQAGGFFPETHTDAGLDVGKFVGDKGKNYIIEGIRGTGKTHILKMINERCLRTYDQKKILPVYVSLAGVSEWIERNITLFRLHLYANIVLTSINTIEKNRQYVELAGNNNPIKALKRVAQMFGLNQDEDFDKILKRIKDVHTSLLSALTYNLGQITDSTSESQQASAQLGVSKGPFTFNFSGNDTETNSEQLQYIGETLSHENAASFIVQYFHELKQILQHSYTLILLDECSEVSKDAQIEVFRLLKLIRGAFGDSGTENTAYFCATVYPTPVTYYPSKLLGDSFNFDTGHDATMEYLHLDELSDDYIGFFAELTKRRVAFVSSKELDTTSHLDIFESERAFLLAAYCANGVVRRYFEILKHAYDNLVQRVDSSDTRSVQKIAVKDVEEGVDTVVSNQVLAQNKLLHNDFVILDDVVGRLTKRNKKNETENKQKDRDSKLPTNVYFTVSRSEMDALGRLIIQGAMHDKGKTRLKKYHKEGGVRGALLMLDLAVAFYHGAIDRTRAVEIFSSDLKKNAKSGYLWCQDFKIRTDD